MRRSALLGLVLLLVAAAPAAAQSPATDFAKGLDQLSTQLTGSLSSSERAAVHKAKAALVTQALDVPVLGTTYAVVFTDTDCVSTAVQRARGSSRSAAPGRAAVGRRCLAHLTRALGTGAVSAKLRSDLRALSLELGAITTAIKGGKAFGAKATTLRKHTATFVARWFEGRPLAGVPFATVHQKLECVDVKVESGATTGAGACARALLRTVRGNLPPSQGGTSTTPSAPPVTFGSDLTGEPVALPGIFQEDSEFWTAGLTIPVAGTITAFRVRVGALPAALPIRFSVVEPQPDGRVKVLTTTNPPYQLPAGSPDTYTFPTSALSFTCCKVKKGDIVTIDNRGAEQTRDPYVWFARKPGFTTFSYENPTPGAQTQDPGQFWSPKTNPDYDLLVQAVLSPN